MDRALQEDLLHCDGAAAKTPDMLGQRGAMRLAKRLEKYWHDQGYPAARFWAEPVGGELVTLA